MLYIRFLNKDLFGLIAKGLNLGFLDIFTTFQLFYPLIDIKALLLGRHVVFKFIIYYILT